MGEIPAGVFCGRNAQNSEYASEDIGRVLEILQSAGAKGGISTRGRHLSGFLKKLIELFGTFIVLLAFKPFLSNI